jgi:putative endonuclease
MKQPAVYIMANKRNGTLYTGVTSDLLQRVHQHREGLMPGFSSRYGCTLFVWYERHDEMPAAIAREKQIKAGPRRKKLALIEGDEPPLARFVRRPRLTHRTAYLSRRRPPPLMLAKLATSRTVPAPSLRA